MQQIIEALVGRKPFLVMRTRCRELAAFAEDKVARVVYKPKHFAFCENNLGLAKLFRHRSIMMETLYERRKKTRDGEQVMVRALFRYHGKKIFVGGNGMTIYSGDIILAEFCLGKNPDDCYIEGSAQSVLPSQFLLHWPKKNGPGVLSSLV